MNLAHVSLVPYVSFAGHAFSLTPDEALRLHGTPLRQQRNEVGLNEHDHGRFVLRFQDSGRLEEITTEAAALHIGTLVVPFAQLEAFIREHDGQAFWRARFLVSPALGLAFDPLEGRWITALARHCLPQWEAL
jgi:hypothetical protein